MGERPKLRLPVAFLLIPAMFFGIFTIISGGVAYTQGPNADWTVFFCLLGGLAVCAALYFSGAAEWISDEELVGMKNAEHEAELEREIEALADATREGSFGAGYWFKRFRDYALLGLLFAGLFFGDVIGDSPMADGSSGMAVFGNHLGAWRLFNRDWTGVEVLFIAGCLTALVLILRKGFDRLARAQKR